MRREAHAAVPRVRRDFRALLTMKISPLVSLGLNDRKIPDQVGNDVIQSGTMLYNRE